MKAAVATALIAFAATGFAVPTENNARAEQAANAKQAANGFFDGFGKGNGGNIFSDIFDSAACVVSGFIGGGNPLCFKDNGKSSGNGLGVNTDSHSKPSKADQEENGYNFTYDTQSDGSYKIKITPKNSSKDSCTYNIDDTDDLQEAISEAASRCL